jgi:ssDNA-binding Zn-finger/Zn-ribbon topoisomerase 1
MRCGACGFKECVRDDNTKYPCINCYWFTPQSTGTLPVCRYHNNDIHYGLPDRCELFSGKDFRKFMEIEIGGVTIYACPECGTVRMSVSEEGL